MKKIFSLLLLLLTINSYSAAPIITSFSPTTGAIGSSVTITGTGFNATGSQNIVYFGATKAVVTAASTTSLTVTVPLGATYQYISVTNLAVNLTAYSEKPFQVTCACNVAFTPTSPSGFTNLGTKDVIADIDGDGKVDIVATNVSNDLTVYHNTSSPGNVSFSPSSFNPSAGSVGSISIGDIDGDGKPDVAIAGSNTIKVMRNTSTSGITSFAAAVAGRSGFYGYYIAIADIDGDGKPDIIGIPLNSNYVCVSHNSSTVGHISFDSIYVVTLGIGTAQLSSLCIGDIDGDGKPDIAFANAANNTIGVIRNTSAIGTISFASEDTFATGTNPISISISIGDIDGDGKLDIAETNEYDNNVSVLRNTSTVGTISFAHQAPFATGQFPSSISIADIDGDGKPDVVFENTNSNTAGVLHNTSTIGTISFSGQDTFATGTEIYLTVGDIDGDGRPDIVVANDGANQGLVLLQLSGPQGSITDNGPFCGPGNGQLTWTATVGTVPYTVVYNDGTSNRTATNVVSGQPFNVFANPVANTTTYTLVSVTDANNLITTSGFTGATATILVNPLPAANITVSGPTTFCQGDSVILTSSAGTTYLWSNNVTSQSTTIFTSGSYSVTTFGSNGCSANSSAIVITINPLPAIPTISSAGNTLTSSASTGNQWYSTGGLIPGAISQNYSALLSGAYSVQVTYSNGCSSTSAPFNFTFSAVQEITAEQNIVIGPNPSNGKFKLGFGQINPVEIKIYNSIGVLVYQSKSITADIDLSNQPKGNYFLLIQTPVGTASKNFIIQ